MRVSADAREGIEVFRSLKKGALETREAFDKATARVAALARELSATEKPSAKLKRDFEGAKREAAGLKDALQQQEQQLHTTRQRLTAAGVDVKNLAAEYRRLGAESQAAATAQAQAADTAAEAVRRVAAEQEKAARWAEVARSRAERAAKADAAAQARTGRMNEIGALQARSTPDAFGALGVRSAKEVQAEINKVQRAMQRLAADSKVTGAEFDRAFAAGNKRIGELRRELDPMTESVARATGGARDLRTQLAPLQAALAGVAAAISVGKILSMAEEYQQYTARLRLATQYTGDFVEMQAALRDVARDTRAPIAETVDLYTKLAPALTGMGRTGQAAADIIGTVNKSIALSGASAGASQASLVQFGQAMGSGVLRGDELNSVLEQTPALADAIAEGLGRSRSELRQMGRDGRLTAEMVAAALEKVKERVDRDFSQLAMTRGQAMTLLRNETLELIGGMDRALGASRLVANSLVLIADNIETVVRYGVPLLVVALIPLVARLGMTAVAATRAAIALAAVNPVQAAIGIAAAAGAYYALNKALEEVAENQGKLNAEEQAAEAKRNAEAREKVAEDLQKAMARLENLRAVAAGKANAEILLSDEELAKKRIEEARKAIDAQIKGYESLGSTLNKVWGDAIEKARSLRAEAAKLQQDAAAARTAGADKAQDRRMRGWREDERDDYARRQARDLRDQASRSATFAQNAALRGDLERAAQLAAEAAKYAERAEKYGDMIQDDDVAANLFEELGRIREDALKAQSQIKQAEVQAQEDLASAVTEQIAQNEERLKALRAELEKPATLQADISQAEAQIKQLQAQLDALKDKTITVTVNTVSTAPADTSGMTREQLIEAIPGRAYGGPLPGTARGDRSDNMIYRGTPGEWVIQRPAVRYWGASFLRAINEMRMPRFAYGGEIGAEQRAPLAAAGSSEGRTPVVLQWPDGSRSPLSASDQVAEEIVRVFQRAALQRGRR